jgi:hypothetical protein
MGTFRWTPTFAHAGTYTVTFRAANVLEGTASTVITVTNVDRAPVVVSPDNLRGTVGKLITVAVTASDPDGEPITSLTANLSQLPSGHNAVFTPNASNTGGTLTWTPSGTANINVTFTAMNARSGSKTTHIQIKRNAVSDSPTSITGEAPAVLSLSSGFPVPSAGDVTFVLGLPRSARVDWTVFDLQGRTMKRQSMESSAGWTSLRWDGRDAGGRHSAPGLYLVRVSVDGVNFVRRVSIR